MEEKRREIIESYIEAYNDFDIEKMLKHLHPDVVFENITNGEVNLRLEGIEAFKEQAEVAAELFSERLQEISSWEIEGDVFAINIAYGAVLANDLPNGMKAGDTLELYGQSIFEFDSDQIVKLQDLS